MDYFAGRYLSKDLELRDTIPQVRACVRPVRNGGFAQKSGVYSPPLFLAEFLESRIVANFVPHRIESQQSRSSCKAIWHLQQPLEDRNRVFGIPQLTVDLGHSPLKEDASPWIFRNGI